MKTNTIVSSIVMGLALVTIQSTQSQTFVAGSPQATVRGGASQTVDIIEGGGSGTASGTVSVKFAAALDTARKHYVKVDLAGQNPNTNGPLYLRYDTAANSQRQRVQVWSLDQVFAGVSSTLTWNSAQANDTNSGSALLTTGPSTATLYGSFLSASTSGQIDFTHLLHGPWGHVIRTDSAAYLALTSSENIGDNGLRLVVNSVELGFEPITAGAPPSLGAITNALAAGGQLTVLQGYYSTATNYFTVADAETAIASLVITNTTSSEASLSTTSVYVEGSGATRQVYVDVASTATPGTNTVVLYLVDSDGNRASRSFEVVVKQFNQPPLIMVGNATNSLPPTNTLMNTPVTVPFAVSDAESANSTLTVTAEVAAYSGSILASATLNGAGPNNNLSVTVVPQTGVDGVGVVQLSCSDTNGNTNTLGFCVMVRSNASVVFVDHFDYQANNSKLTDDAPNLWTRRNASAQSVFLRSATDPLNLATVAWVRPNSGAEDLAGRLADGTYGPGSGAVLYTKFHVDFAEATPGNIITNVNGDSPFFRLSDGASSTTDFANLIAVQDKSATDFTLLLSDGSTNFNSWASTFAKPGAASYTSMTVISRFDAGTGHSTLWLNATNEAELPQLAGGSGQDPTPVGYVGLFQERGNGDIYLDDLTVIVKFKPRLTTLSQPSGGSVNIDFAAGATDVIGDFAVERATTVNGTYAGVAATITALGGGNFRATVAAPGSEGYYQVKRTPIAF